MSGEDLEQIVFSFLINFVKTLEAADDRGDPFIALRKS